VRTSPTSALRRTVATLAAGALLAIGATAAAAPAAAVNTCYLTTTYRALSNASLYVVVPGCGVMSQGADWERERLDYYSLEGSAVWTLQHALKYCYGHNLVLDGIFGKGTRNALGQTQASLRLIADGVFGPATSVGMAWPLRDANGRLVGGCGRAYRG
jgi:hypothetical protein